MHFGVHTSYAVLATRCRDIDFPLVSTSYVPGYSAEELAEIRATTDAATDVLATQYEEEVLPGEGGELISHFYFTFLFSLVDEMARRARTSRKQSLAWNSYAF